MNPSSQNSSYPPFRPSLDGCVGRDLRLARMLTDCYLNELYAHAANTYRSLLCEKGERTLSDLFDELAADENEHFRLLGGLILALGGDPMIRTQLGVGGNITACDGRWGMRMLDDALCEKKKMIDRYQTVMGHTQDRVVRSVLLYLLENEERHVERLQRAGNKD